MFEEEYAELAMPMLASARILWAGSDFYSNFRILHMILF
jgi:hypothetical protein